MTARLNVESINFKTNALQILSYRNHVVDVVLRTNTQRSDFVLSYRNHVVDVVLRTSTQRSDFVL